MPLYILGSSLFGAQLAAALGLPYAFASHFAPQALTRPSPSTAREFTPSEQLAEPYVIAGVNVVAADTTEEARALQLQAQRIRVSRLLGRGRIFTDAEADAVLESPAGRQLQQMARYTAVGTPDEVRDYLDRFAEQARADELIVVSMAPGTAATLRTFEQLAHFAELPG